MTAHRLGSFEPGSEGWEDARRFRLGGGEAAAVLGLSPWESRLSLWLKKKGLIARDYSDNPEQEWGRRIEPVVARKFLEEHREEWQTNPGLYRHGTRTWQLANPDGLATQQRDGLFEIKVARRTEGWGDEGTDEIPVHYRCQVLQYLDVFDLDFGWVVALIGQTSYREYLIERDDDDIAILREEGERFVTDLINDRMPDIDRHSATYQAVRELHPDILPGSVEVDPDLAGDYLAAVIAEKEAKADKEFHGARILDQLGDLRDALVDGARFAYRTHRSRDGQPGTPFLAADRKRLEQVQFPRTIREALNA